MERLKITKEEIDTRYTLNSQDPYAEGDDFVWNFALFDGETIVTKLHCRAKAMNVEAQA